MKDDVASAATGATSNSGRRATEINGIKESDDVASNEGIQENGGVSNIDPLPDSADCEDEAPNRKNSNSSSEHSDRKLTESESPEAPAPENQLQNGKPSAKKSKRKSKDVWNTTSRKGRKRAKHAANSNHKSNPEADDKVLITPISRFPDKNDDSPESHICLSKVYKAEKVELSEDRLTASSTKGYRMVRATRGVSQGAWYFEVKVMHLGETGHTRLGWSTDKGDLQAPVGYDGHSFGYRDVDGSKVHKALREEYGGEGYKEGDIIGFYINLPDGESYAPEPDRYVWYKGQRYVCERDGNKDNAPKAVPGSECSFFKNGECQGVAFRDLPGGHYYPAASMYTLPNQPNCVVKFNFGPDFEAFPTDFTGRPVPRPMFEVQYKGYEARVENADKMRNGRPSSSKGVTLDFLRTASWDSTHSFSSV
ncbi:hypothetical protein M569_08653 [Genlisea aurea]|uniref:B30.2/SPRY domain-containing protein n=1 Tax=Genlisea aurea TaxID=192259 RepID=S8CGM6_9LAMI|nr:hypothetical protein M569_08653 [Genlisea aurea]